MNISQAKTLHLPTVLELAGAWLDPAKSSPGQNSYFFKLRDEKTASVHVWQAPNGSWCWKDHGTGEGGDIIKLGQYMTGGGTVSEGLSWLRSNAKSAPERPSQRPQQPPEPSAPIESKYEVDKVKHLFAKPYNRNLLAFINSRGVSPKIVANYVQEVHFADKKEKKKMYGLGLKSEPTETSVLGGWEIRTALNGFPKCVIGDKNVSVIDSPGLSRKTLHVFEGMFDFFTWLEMTGQHHAKHPPAPVIVLNSATMAARAAQLINTDKRFATTEQIIIWPQTDHAGQNAVIAFGDAIDHDRFKFGTMDYLYEGAKDINEWWLNIPEADRPKMAANRRGAEPAQKFYDTSASGEMRRLHDERLKNRFKPEI